jgi:hypothetical protein
MKQEATKNHHHHPCTAITRIPVLAILVLLNHSFFTKIELISFLRTFFHLKLGCHTSESVHPLFFCCCHGERGNQADMKKD